MSSKERLQVNNTAVCIQNIPIRTTYTKRAPVHNIIVLRFFSEPVRKKLIQITTEQVNIYRYIYILKKSI